MQTFARKPNQPQEKVSANFARSNLASFHRTIGDQAIQTKPAIGKPRDEYEQEADRISDQVMRMPEPQLQRACACGGGCPTCMPAHDHSGGAILQTKRIGANDARGMAVPPVVNEVLRSPGQALDPQASTFFGPRFGQDFAGVRVHADARAAASARALNARAYTVGRDVVFGQGQYQPATTSGRQLIAHELAHVVQQSGAAAPRVQAKVVDDDEHLPCRADDDKNAATVAAQEEKAAKMADDAASKLRARPLGETARLLLWEKFRLDYNDPVNRCQFVPEIADRLERIAHDLRKEEITYGCERSGEPTPACHGHWAVTSARWPGGGYRIDLCSNFWRDKDDQALTLLHEWAHYVFWARGLRDELPGGFNTGGCYSAFALEVNGGPPNAIENTKCVPNPSRLPDLDQARVEQSCPRNVFPSLTLTGGYASGLPGGRSGFTSGARLDLLFPLAHLHEWELTVGAQFQRLAPQNPTERAPFMFGIRAGIQVRQQPRSFGLQVGAYAEGGGITRPDASGDYTFPYLGLGAKAGINIPFSRQQALQLFVDFGASAGFDTKNDNQFLLFQAGLGVALQLP